MREEWPPVSWTLSPQCRRYREPPSAGGRSLPLPAGGDRPWTRLGPLRHGHEHENATQLSPPMPEDTEQWTRPQMAPELPSTRGSTCRQAAFLPVVRIGSYPRHLMPIAFAKPMQGFPIRERNRWPQREGDRITTEVDV